MIDSLQKLFEDTLKDTYSAEKQFLAAMPKLAKAATDPNLMQIIQDHIEQTENHVQRLEQAAQMIGINPGGKTCQAAQGLVKEAEENLSEVAKGSSLDAAIIACAQKNEHYEISPDYSRPLWVGH